MKHTSLTQTQPQIWAPDNSEICGILVYNTISLLQLLFIHESKHLSHLWIEYIQMHEHRIQNDIKFNAICHFFQY